MASGLVVPFFRGPTHVDLHARALFARGLSDDAFADGLRRTPAAFRVNVARVLAAALLADAEERPLAVVEGWRANVVDAPGGRPGQVLTGSRVAVLILRLLGRRALVPAHLRALRVDVSRCTRDEAQAAAALRQGGELTAIAGTACPSARRAHRYVRAFPPATALTPSAALARAGRRDGRAAAVVHAAALRPAELAAALALEGAAWTTHALSVVEARLVRPTTSFEQRLAHRLRRDR